MQGAGTLGPLPLESQEHPPHTDTHPAGLWEPGIPTSSSRPCPPNSPPLWWEGWPAGGRETGRTRPELTPGSAMTAGKKHALFSLRAPLWKTGALGSPEPLPSQMSSGSKGTSPTSWRKASHGATLRFALRQHHLLAVLGMTPILFSGDPRIPARGGCQTYTLSITLHLEQFINSSQQIVPGRCCRVPIL